MQVFSHARPVCKSGANIQMGSANYASAAERWDSNCWVEDLTAAPLVICRAVCAVFRLQRQQGLTTSALVQDDMSKARSVNKDWEFVSKGTEISLGKFVPEYFTPLTLDLKTGVVSTEDTGEIWEEAKEEVMEKVRGRSTRTARADSPMTDETEEESLSVSTGQTGGW